MSNDIPSAVLSEQFAERIAGRRLVAAVFLTYKFDPSFFEEQVVPVFLDLPVSHSKVRLVQLEEALKTIDPGIAVYYDQHGLVPDAEPAKLDVRRIPVCHTAIFHPKNVFALVEDAEPDEDGNRERALLVATMSANLTRSGWWENVEVCHIEELREGDASRLRDDLLDCLRALRSRTKLKDEHRALHAVEEFLRKSVEQRGHRSAAGHLHAHFYSGRQSVADFLGDVAGSDLRGMYLEVISPYFDDRDESRPLAELIDRFAPREVRVFLPRGDGGEALCNAAFYEWVRSQPGVSWGHLPKDLVRSKRDDAKPRTVHAKVYRFFQLQPKREILFVGSPNLTTPAHHLGGNAETGVLIEVETPRRPDWWLIPDDRKPREFAPRSETEGTASSGGTRLSLRFHWNKRAGEALWDAKTASPELQIQHAGVDLFTIAPLPPAEWVPLSTEANEHLERVLRSTSILHVAGDGPEPAALLVQEEGMWDRPSLVLDLSASDILRYWSLLTAEQRAAFIEARAPSLADDPDGAALLAKFAPIATEGSFFDRFAGIFHAFGCLERGVRESLAAGRERDAVYRVFGSKYDSLGNLLTRVRQDVDAGKGDDVEHYVTALCARQLTKELRRAYPDLFREHAAESARVEEQLAIVDALRERVAARDATRMPEFLGWFEKWFLRRAQALAVEEA